MTTPRDRVIDADYLVVGAGALGMAFADTVLHESDATVAMVDRYGAPGGHWTRAYPFVRLHQPSAFYGVNSKPLGRNEKDTATWNAGLFELASGAEVVAYFDQLMQQEFLPSGRVQFFPMCEYAEGGAIVSLVSGEAREVRARKVVDATYSQVEVPSMRPPAFEVAVDATCVPPNALTTLDHKPSAYVVIGAGKTGMDACLWLLAAGVDKSDISWIMPRDSWLLDRATIQPTADFFESTVGGFALQMEAAALATSVDDLFERLESSGQLLRIDRSVRPTMYRCATVSIAELQQLRRIENVVRMGHVRSIAATEIVLDNGTIGTSLATLHIDCTGDGLGRRPAVPVFEEDRITLQSVRTCQPAFSAAFIGHIETAYDDESTKNDLCAPIPHPDSDIDWLSTAMTNAINTARWNQDAELAAWLRGSRLDAYSQATPGANPSPERLAILGKVAEYAPRAAPNLERLLAEAR
jgi:hypothetical protein